MNKEQVKGRVDEAVGKVKEATGKVTDDKSLQAKGMAQQVGGQGACDGLAMSRKTSRTRARTRTRLPRIGARLVNHLRAMGREGDGKRWLHITPDPEPLTPPMPGPTPAPGPSPISDPPPSEVPEPVEVPPLTPPPISDPPATTPMA